MADTIFKKIIDKEIPAEILYEDDELLAFKDINPQGPIHYLIIPKKEIATINDAQEEDALLLGKVILLAKKLAKEAGIDEEGYRLVFNVNKNGCQEVFHIHLHLIGGRQLNWPPG